MARQRPDARRHGRARLLDHHEPEGLGGSGHVGGFSDPMVDCRATKERYRADQLYVFAYVFPAVEPQGRADRGLALGPGRHRPRKPPSSPRRRPPSWPRSSASRPHPPTVIPYMQLDATDREKVVGPSTDDRGTLTEPRAFNLMFKTYVGALENESNVAYLRPETAQGIFVNFKNVVDTGRVKLPFGIAQIGKSFRNEINPRNFTFRSREFEQMEIEFFCQPDEATEWYEYWREGPVPVVRRPRPAVATGCGSATTTPTSWRSTRRPRPTSSTPSRSASASWRGSPTGATTTSSQHMKFSGKDLSYFDEEQQGAVRARTSIEPSAGADRATLAFLCEAYTEDEVGGEARTVLKFHPRLAPIKAAVFPLVKKDGMPEKAEAIYRELKRHFNVFYDEKGAIGRRYRRQDEAGTPFCITVDGQTLTDDTVTIRDRDSCRQWRVPVGRRRPGAPRPARRPADPGGILSAADAIARHCGRRDEPDHLQCITLAASMKPCISQATTLSTPFEADLPAYRARRLDGGRALADEAGDVPREAHRSPRPARCSRSSGLTPAAAAGAGGAAALAGPEREAHWDHFRRRLAILQELGVPTLIVAADFVRELDARRLRPRRRRAGRGRRAGRRVRASGWRWSSRRRPAFCSSLDTTLALIAQCGAPDAGRLPRPVPLLHRAEQVRGPRLPVAARTSPGSRSAT